MSTSKYPNEIKINPNQGGKAAIERLVEAYGFTTRQALADHLEVSKSTLANRYMRDTFPADWIIQCALETGISLNWLTTGQGMKERPNRNNICEIEKQNLSNGKLESSGYYFFDEQFLPIGMKNPIVIIDEKSEFICEREFDDIRDGKWVVSIDGEILIRSLTRLPSSRIYIAGGNHSFECAISDIKIIAKILISCTR